MGRMAVWAWGFIGDEMWCWERDRENLGLSKKGQNLDKIKNFWMHNLEGERFQAYNYGGVKKCGIYILGNMYLAEGV